MSAGSRLHTNKEQRTASVNHMPGADAASTASAMLMSGAYRSHPSVSVSTAS